MSDDEVLFQLPLVDRLELVAFDLELRRAPRALIAAVWSGSMPEKMAAVGSG
jgi:hypothetical protein